MHAVSLQKLVVTPRTRSSQQLHQPHQETSAPDGVQLSSEALQGGKDPFAPAAGPANAKRSAAAPEFSEQDVQHIMAESEGPGQWTRVTTQSGVRGQVLESSDGIRCKFALPSGVLAEPILLETAPGKLEAQTLQGRKLPIEQQDETFRIQLDSGTAVFDRKSYAFGMQSEERKESDNTHRVTRTDGPEDWEQTLGRTTFRQNLSEIVQADGTREIIADRYHIHDDNENGHDNSIGYYRITETPGGKIQADFVVEGQDHSYFVDPYSSWDKRGSVRYPMDVRKSEDGAFLLTPAGGLRSVAASAGNFVRNFGKKIFIQDQLNAQQPADQVIVKPFSAHPND